MQNVRDDEAERACAQALVSQRVATAELVYAPPIDLKNSRPPSTSSNVVMHGDATPQWADIAFWVAPDGTVRDIETVRTSPNAGGEWLKLVVEALSKRVYRPLQLASSEPGLRRIERYSLVYDVAAVKGSRIPVRSTISHVETLDLTIEPTKS